jgi:hypothetical protein
MNDGHPFVPTCRHCGKYMIATSKDYISCPDGCGKLVPRPKQFHQKMRAYKRELFKKKVLAWQAKLPNAIWTRGRRRDRKMLFTILGGDGVFVFDGYGEAKPFDSENVGLWNGKPRKFAKVQ